MNFAKALPRASVSPHEVETFKTIAIFCGIGLLVSLLLVNCGLDLSCSAF